MHRVATATATGTSLVVEDGERMRAAIERLVCATGLDCHTYSSAETLREAGAADGADCVICDMMLSGMSGLELLSCACGRRQHP
jgi:FixJ family two-component response regulator